MAVLTVVSGAGSWCSCGGCKGVRIRKRCDRGIHPNQADNIAPSPVPCSRWAGAVGSQDLWHFCSEAPSYTPPSCNYIMGCAAVFISQISQQYCMKYCDVHLPDLVIRKSLQQQHCNASPQGFMPCLFEMLISLVGFSSGWDSTVSGGSPDLEEVPLYLIIEMKNPQHTEVADPENKGTCQFWAEKNGTDRCFMWFLLCCCLQFKLHIRAMSNPLFCQVRQEALGLQRNRTNQTHLKEKENMFVHW